MRCAERDTDGALAREPAAASRSAAGLSGPRRAPEVPPAVAGYAVRPVAVDLGDRALTVLVVSRPEEYVNQAALLRDPDAPEPPYWIHLWPGSRALARMVAQRPSWRGQRVLEIGCGLGLAGIAAAVRGAEVVMMDSAFDALRLARANAALNACRVAAVHGDVRTLAVRGSFDACLVADVTYDPRLQEAIAAALDERLAPGGVAWCAESVRTSDAGFRRACERRGLQVAEWEVREPEDGHAVQVRIAEVKRP